jgi:hypothetical protein
MASDRHSAESKIRLSSNPQQRARARLSKHLRCQRGNRRR